MDPPVARTGGKKNKREVVVGVRVTTEALSAIDKMAAKEERTRSDMLRILLRVGMENRK